MSLICSGRISRELRPLYIMFPTFIFFALTSTTRRHTPINTSRLANDASVEKFDIRCHSTFDPEYCDEDNNGETGPDERVAIRHTAVMRYLWAGLCNLSRSRDFHNTFEAALVGLSLKHVCSYGEICTCSQCMVEPFNLPDRGDLSLETRFFHGPYGNPLIHLSTT